jgi:hypothetical protein
MSEMKLRLRALGDVAGDLHDRFIVVDAEIKARSGTLRSMFGKVPFHELLELALALQADFTAFIHQVRGFSDEHRHALDKDQSDFLHALDVYATALADTGNALVERQEAAYQGSRSALTSQITWQEFRRLQSNYESCIRRYSQAGVALEARAQQVLS